MDSSAASRSPEALRRNGLNSEPFPMRDSAAACVQGRDVDRARLEAEIALGVYAAHLREWNAPDDEHTRIQVRRLAEEVIDTAMTSCGS